MVEMNTYLVVMMTVLVITQLIRVIQNTVNLMRQNNEIKKACDWIKDNDISETDFNTQREVFYMMYAKMLTEMRYVKEWREEYEKLKER